MQTPTKGPQGPHEPTPQPAGQQKTWVRPGDPGGTGDIEYRLTIKLANKANPFSLFCLEGDSFLSPFNLNFAITRYFSASVFQDTAANAIFASTIVLIVSGF